MRPLAERLRKEHLDGFRLVDDTIARFGELGNPVNQGLAKKLILNLDRAQRSSKLESVLRGGCDFARPVFCQTIVA